MKKKNNIIPIIILAFIATAFGLLWLVSYLEEDEYFPTFMDNRDKIEVWAGDFKLEKQPMLGVSDAPVTVVEFGDYKCPSCAKWTSENWDRFKADYIDTGVVKFYYIHFPFLGPDSIKASIAAEALYKQSNEAFWTFHHAIYSKQGAAGTVWANEKFILSLVKSLELDIDYEQFTEDLKNYTQLFDVKEDFKISNANGVSGVPTFFVNGEKLNNSMDYSELVGLIEHIR